MRAEIDVNFCCEAPDCEVKAPGTLVVISASTSSFFSLGSNLDTAVPVNCILPAVDDVPVIHCVQKGAYLNGRWSAWGLLTFCASHRDGYIEKQRLEDPRSLLTRWLVPSHTVLAAALKRHYDDFLGLVYDPENQRLDIQLGGETTIAKELALVRLDTCVEVRDGETPILRFCGDAEQDLE